MLAPGALFSLRVVSLVWCKVCSSSYSIFDIVAVPLRLIIPRVVKSVVGLAWSGAALFWAGVSWAYNVAAHAPRLASASYYLSLGGVVLSSLIFASTVWVLVDLVVTVSIVVRFC